MDITKCSVSSLKILCQAFTAATFYWCLFTGFYCFSN